MCVRKISDYLAASTEYLQWWFSSTFRERIVNTKLQPSLCLWGPAFRCMRPYPTSVKDSYVLETTYKFGSLSHLCSFGPIPSQWYASLHFSAGLFCPSLCPLYGKLEACLILCQIRSNRSLYVLVQSSLVGFCQVWRRTSPKQQYLQNLGRWDCRPEATIHFSCIPVPPEWFLPRW